MQKGLFALALSIPAGCATTLSPQASRLVEAEESGVSGCKFLGTVQGSSGWGNVAASAGMRNAKNEATERASALGASHIVFTAISGGYSPNAQGKAYLCKK